MALTTAQKHDVLLYLGWPGKTLVTSSTHYNKTVADRLDNLNSDIETQVGSLLTAIAAVRTKYTASTSRALVKKVGDIELNTDEHMALGKEDRRLVKELSCLLDIELRCKSSRNVNLVV